MTGKQQASAACGQQTRRNLESLSAASVIYANLAKPAGQLKRFHKVAANKQQGHSPPLLMSNQQLGHDLVAPHESGCDDTAVKSSKWCCSACELASASRTACTGAEAA